MLEIVREMTALVARATVQAMFATSLTPAELGTFLDDLSAMLDGLIYRVIFAADRPSLGMIRHAGPLEPPLQPGVAGTTAGPVADVRALKYAAA